MWLTKGLNVVLVKFLHEKVSPEKNKIKTCFNTVVNIFKLIFTFVDYSTTSGDTVFIFSNLFVLIIKIIK